MPPTIDLFDYHNLLEFIDETQGFKPTEFLSKTFFPASTNIDGKDIIIDIFKGKRRVAPFVSPLVEGKPVEKRGYKTTVITPPYLKPFMVTTSADILKRWPGEVPFSGGKSGMDLAEIRLGQDMEELMDMIRRRMELMASQALFEGKVTVLGDGVDAEIDFLRDASHEYALTGTDAWSDGTGSDPIFDLRKWRLQIQEDSGLNADIVIFPEDVLEVFLNHPKVQKILDNRRVENIARVAFFEQDENVNFIANVFGLDILTYNAWYLDDAGVSKPFIPARHVVMGVSGARSDNATHFGAIQDLDAGMVTLPMFAKSWRVPNPSAQFIMVQSAPLVALKRPETTVVAEVLEP